MQRSKSFYLAAALLGVLGFAALATAQAPSGNTNSSYLPLVQHPLDTPTATATLPPTATPTPTSTPEPQLPTLRDGFYRVTFSGSIEGWIEFRVADGGQTVYDAGYSAEHRGCFAFEYWEEPKGIENGYFAYYNFDPVNLVLYGSLQCTSETDTSASCRIYVPVDSSYQCGGYFSGPVSWRSAD